ncbi:multi-sensor hybrid histidine kinase [Tolypothrix sp. NIES-4075]|nr:multi-sensor hybrid histidine kinase [Tolypothrix sp. NIES-4075]
MDIDLTGLVNQLRATLGKMELALGAIADAIVWTGQDGKVQWCNAAFDKLVNKPHILVLNVKLTDLLLLKQAGITVKPEFYPDVKVRRNEYQAAEEYEFQQEDRSLILEISGNFAELPGGDKSAVMVIRDVTKAKRSEAKRLQVEQEQAQTLSLLQATLESTADGIIVVNKNFNVSVFNQKFLQMWALPESLLQPEQSNERFMFMSQQTRDPEAFIARVKELFFKYPEQEAFDLVEMKDGRVFDRYSQPQWHNGEIIGRVWSFRDITARSQVEAALSESETKFRRIVENANDVISLIDLEGKICYISPNLFNLTGYHTSELESVVFSNFLHPDDLPRCLEAFQKVVTTGEKQSGIEYRARLKDNTWQWQATNLSTSQDANGNLLVLSVAGVITERKQVELALRLSEQKYRHIFENSQVGIFRSRIEDGLTLDANQRCADLLGYSCASEIIGKTFSRQFYVNPSDRTAILTQLHEKGVVNNIEIQYRQCNGSVRWGLFSLRLNIEEDCIEAVVTDITNRKQTEADLHRSNAILKAQQEASIDGILIVDQNNQVIFYNQRFYQLWQIPEILIQSTSARQLRESLVDKLEQPQEFLTKIEYLYAHPDEVSRDEIIMKDGKTLDRYSASVRSPTGDCYGRIWYFRDITERKQVEQSLRQSEERFRSLYQSTSAAVVLAEDGIPFDCNRAAEELFGYSCQELLSRHPGEVSPPLQPNGENSFSLATQHLTLANEQGSHCFEWVHRRCDGTDFPAEVWLTVVKVGDRHLMQSVIQDLTKRKQAEEVIRHRAQVDRLLNKISRQFIDQDADTAINFTLQAIAEFMGAEQSRIFEYLESDKQFHKVHEWRAANLEAVASTDQESPFEMFPWFYNQILDGNFVQGLQVSGIAEIIPETVVEKSFPPEEIIHSVVAVPTIHSGKVVGFIELDVVNSSKSWNQEEINLLQRVSELIAIGRSRHQTEEALRIAKEAAETANRSKSAFLANMSHELRTPLNAILGFAQLMERDTTLSDRQREWLSTINRSGEHLLNLINDVLEMSKIEAGRIVLNPVSFDLHQLLQTIQEMFQVRSEAKKLSLQMELAPNLPQYILADEGKLRQVLINLLGNAIKFTDTGGVTLRVGIGNGEWVIGNRELGIGNNSFPSPQSPVPSPQSLIFEIEDTGKGIAKEEFDKLFQPFVQTASAAKIREGTGLGLTISRQFVQLMGGDIRLESAVGRGSTFYFDVKIELAQSSEVAPAASPEKAIALVDGQPVYRILVVDDRKENCDLLTQLFNTVGFETRAAENGCEAIAIWQTWHPHLIWMDMRMPVMDGYEATRQIRAMERGTGGQGGISPPSPPLPHFCTDAINPVSTTHTVIIALTASAFEEQRPNILAAGCDDLIRKPFREEVLFHKMAEYLGVKYIYAEKDNLAQTKLIASERELQPKDLLVMPSEWVSALHQAAFQVDAELILDLIAQIPDTYLTLAEGLTNLVDGFCFDEIIELAQGNDDA